MFAFWQINCLLLPPLHGSQKKINEEQETRLSLTNCAKHL